MRQALRGSNSNGSIDRIGAPGTASRFMRKRLVVLLLFGLVLGGLILSSMSLVMHQSSGMTSAGSDQPLHLRLQVKSRRAPADADPVATSSGSGSSSSKESNNQHQEQGKPGRGKHAADSQEQQQTGATSASQSAHTQWHRWRWKHSKQQPKQVQHKQSGPLWTPGTGSSSQTGSAGLALPSNLVEQLQQQPPAELTAATPLTKTAASQAAAAVAAPEDLSLILATENDRERHQQQQQQSSQGVAAVGVQPGVDPVDATSAYIKARGVAPTRVKHPLWWHGPMWAGSGYGSEAVNYVLSLLRTGRLAPADVWAYHHGDGWREHVVKSMSVEDRGELEYLQSLPVKYRNTRSAVVVCHSVPTNWAFPEPMWVSGAPCPPNPKEFAWVYSVGRTMFETDRLPAVFVPRLNAMNEIWVPSEWQRQSFIQSGVDATKLVVVPEGVNTSLFDPDLYTPLPLRDKAQLVFGRHWEVKLGLEEPPAAAPAAAAKNSSMLPSSRAAGLTVSGHNSSAGTASEKRTLLQTQQKALSAAAAASLRATREASGPEAALGSRATTRGSDSGKTSIGGSSSARNSSSTAGRRPFRFISTFKWEQRKGWNILLEAYLTAFTADDDVELYILTQPFGKSGSSFKEKMTSWAGKLNITHSRNSLGRSLLDTGSSIQHTALGLTELSEQWPVSAAAAAAVGLETVSHQHSDGQQRGSSSSSTAEGHSTEADTAENSKSDQQQVWSAHVSDVVQQMQDFAQGLQHTRQLLVAPAAGSQARTLAQTPSTPTTQQQQPLSRSTAAAAGGAAQPQPLAAAQAAAQKVAADQPGAKAAPEAADAAQAGRYPTLYVVNSHIADADFPRFYKAGDAFVLPSRGEGWGRPHVEAMAMGLPVISTNWSGITAYLDESVGYPIAVDGLVPVSGSGDDIMWWFRGLKWAQPSVKHLAQLMRRVYSNRAEAAARGAAGRVRMVKLYSPEAIADVVVKELQRIQDKVP